MKPSLSPGLVLLVSAYFLPLAALPAQTDDARSPVSVQIDFGSSRVMKPTKSSRASARVGLDPNQTVAITLQYPAEMAGRAIVAEPLDGGRVLVPGKELVIDAAGMLRFGFVARDVAGHARITLYDGEAAYTLQFWVRDTEYPERNPKDIGDN